MLILRAAGYKAIPAYSLESVRSVASNIHPDLAIMDFFFEGNSSINTAMHVRNTYGCPVLLLSGASIAELRELGCQGFKILHKPIHPNELLTTVRRILGSADSSAHTRQAA